MRMAICIIHSFPPQIRMFACPSNGTKTLPDTFQSLQLMYPMTTKGTWEMFEMLHLTSQSSR